MGIGGKYLFEKYLFTEKIGNQKYLLTGDEEWISSKTILLK